MTKKSFFKDLGIQSRAFSCLFLSVDLSAERKRLTSRIAARQSVSPVQRIFFGMFRK